jgi:hypothetical protein
MLSREEYERPLPPASAVDELIGSFDCYSAQEDTQGRG